jgi:predicted RNase H-like HicB family nuclease
LSNVVGTCRKAGNDPRQRKSPRARRPLSLIASQTLLAQLATRRALLPTPPLLDSRAGWVAIRRSGSGSPDVPIMTEPCTIVGRGLYPSKKAIAMPNLANGLNQECLHVRYWREDGAYVVQCLDIPGCVSQGATYEEAMANINDAISLCLQVIAEESANSNPEPLQVEILELPLENFLRG